jgi:Ca2+-binding RTX toxin-like protein
MALYYGTTGSDAYGGTAGADRIFGAPQGQTTPEYGDDTLSGAGGNDAISGSFGDNRLFGGDGDDGLSAGDGDDYMSGDAGADTIQAARGNDTIFGGNDNDTVYAFAGDGNDFIDGGAGLDTLDLSSGNFLNGVSIRLSTTAAQNTIGAGTDTIRGFETIIGSAFDDHLVGNGLANLLTGGSNGADTLEGGGGDDTLIGSTEPYNFGDTASYSGAERGVTVSLELQNRSQDTRGAGADWLQSIENLTGSAYRDLLTGDGGRNVLQGGGGYDTLVGVGGDDTYVLDGVADPNRADPPLPPSSASLALAFLSYDSVVEQDGGGVDTVLVSRTSRTSYTLAANVENGTIATPEAFALTGNALANILTGNGNNDTLNGGVGDDTLTGGLGDDTYLVDRVGDRVVETIDFGLGGIDTVVASLSWTLGDQVEKLTLSGRAVSGVGNGLANTITGNEGDNRLFGNAGADTLFGMAGNDSLSGGDGADALSGGIGDDTLLGGADADRISGSTGADQIFGQAGADRFVYLDVGDSSFAVVGRDVLRDFKRVEGDRIDLAGIDANANLSGDQAFEYIGAREFSAAGQLRWKAFDGFSLIYGDVDGDGTPDFCIRADGVTGFATADFFL